VFPLIKLAKKLKAFCTKLKRTLKKEKFPLIKLAKKLKVLFLFLFLRKKFPLIKLAKKLKEALPIPNDGYIKIDWFPLIKLAKKLKDKKVKKMSHATWFPLIKLAKKLKD
jgi:hypothetical protein